MEMRMTAGNGLWLRMARVIPAPRPAVWQAMTNPDEIAKWWGPKGFKVPSVDFEPGIGRNFRIAMQPPGGDVFHLLGEFREVDSPFRLCYTFVWDPPDPDDRETVVTLSLHDSGEQTEVQLLQGEFTNQDRLDLHDNGWRESFEKLEALLGNRR
jgi:uncharacterized protein YndB with AHSA1/START domain